MTLNAMSELESSDVEKIKRIIKNLKSRNLERSVKYIETLEIHFSKDLVDIVYEKAINDDNFLESAALLCKGLATKQVCGSFNFAKSIATRCKEEFDEYINYKKENIKQKENSESSEETKSIHIRSLANLRFIRELFEQELVTRQSIDCYLNELCEYITIKDVSKDRSIKDKLLPRWSRRQIVSEKLDEESLECIYELLKRNGKESDSQNKIISQLLCSSKFSWWTDDRKLSEISPRIRSMYEELNVLRKTWMWNNFDDECPKPKGWWPTVISESRYPFQTFNLRTNLGFGSVKNSGCRNEPVFERMRTPRDKEQTSSSDVEYDDNENVDRTRGDVILETPSAAKKTSNNHQQSPIDGTERKVYDREFLINLQNDPNSKIKPLDLPNLDVILKDKTKNKRGSVDLRQFKEDQRLLKPRQPSAKPEIKKPQLDVTIEQQETKEASHLNETQKEALKKIKIEENIESKEEAASNLSLEIRESATTMTETHQERTPLQLQTSEKSPLSIVQNSEECLDKETALTIEETCIVPVETVVNDIVDLVTCVTDCNEIESLSVAQKIDEITEVSEFHVPSEEEQKCTPISQKENDNENVNEEQDCRDSAPKELPPLKYTYETGQWSPRNKDGKKVYDREFLIKLQSDPNSKIKPTNLPDLEVVLKDNSRSHRGFMDLRQFKDVGMGRHDAILFPGFVKSSQSARGPLGPKRGSQQGKPRAWELGRLKYGEGEEDDAKLQAWYKRNNHGFVDPRQFRHVGSGRQDSSPIPGFVESSEGADCSLVLRRSGQQGKPKGNKEPPPMDNLELGKKNMFQWSRNVSTYAPTSSMSEEQLAKKSAYILEEYLSDTNINNAALEVNETFDNATFASFVREVLNGVVEKSVTARKQVSQLITHLISKNILPLSLYLAGLGEVLDTAEHLVIDIPKIWVYLAELIWYPLVEGVQPFSELKTSLVLLKHKSLAGKLMGELMIKLVQEKSPKWITDKWVEAGLKWSDFLNENESLNDFIKTYKLEFIHGDSSSGFGSLSGVLSMEQIHERLLSLMSNKNENSFDNICSWISANVGERAKEPQFIRVLITAILEISIEAYNNTWKFRPDKFHDLQTLIARYIDNAELLELQCLIAIQEYIHKLEHPSGVLLQVIEKLWNESILSHDAFVAWESNKDPAAATGKSVAMMALTTFFTSLKEADDESSAEVA